MNEWKAPVGNDWIPATSIKRYNRWLSLNYLELIRETEYMLSIGPASQKMDDRFDLLERWIRRQLRTWSGGDLDEFAVINSKMMTGGWRTDYYLQDIFHIVCNDPVIRTYLAQLIDYPTIEQIARISNLLREHPSLKKIRFTHRGVWGPMATLIYRMGLEKILTCEKDGTSLGVQS